MSACELIGSGLFFLVGLLIFVDARSCKVPSLNLCDNIEDHTPWLVFFERILLETLVACRDLVFL